MKLALKKTGFTLIELMVVVAIIGILMAAGILAFSNAQQNARDSRRRADIDAMSKAMKQYYQNNSLRIQQQPPQLQRTSHLDQIQQTHKVRHTTPATATAYCTCATLEKTGRNATALGAGGSCTYGTGASANYFCASQRQ